MSTSEDTRRWWRTEIVDIEPNKINVRGYPIQELIGQVTFPSMIWLMLRGELPNEAQAQLLEATLVASVDHGPHAPSIATARMAVTCGLALNNAMASGVNALGDVHGGAGQQAMSLYGSIHRRMIRGEGLEEAVSNGIEQYTAEFGKFLPGFGHRFHSRDPRSGRLMKMVEDAKELGYVKGEFLDIGREVERNLTTSKGRPIPMNIDGATAVVFSELGFEPELGRGLFVLSRSVGILAHAWEQRLQGGRIKGPMPPGLGYSYEGPGERAVPEAEL